MFIIGALLLGSAAVASDTKQQWQLVWCENFDSAQINDSVWSKIPRGNADWNRHMTPYDSLYDISDGILTLHGVNNHNLEADTAKYLTGGVWTKGKNHLHLDDLKSKPASETHRELGRPSGYYPLTP